MLWNLFKYLLITLGGFSIVGFEQVNTSSVDWIEEQNVFRIATQKMLSKTVFIIIYLRCKRTFYQAIRLWWEWRIKGNFSPFTSDLFLQKAVNSNKLNRITFDCSVSENSMQWERKVLTIFTLKFGGLGELLKVCWMYSLNKWHYTEMLFFRKFLGMLPCWFSFVINLVETWNKSRGKFIHKNICDNDKDLPTMEDVIITPPKKRKAFLSRLFLNLPTDIAGNCSTKLGFLWIFYHRGIRLF